MRRLARRGLVGVCVVRHTEGRVSTAAPAAATHASTPQTPDEPGGEEETDMLPNGIRLSLPEAVRIIVQQHAWDSLPTWEKVGTP